MTASAFSRFKFDILVFIILLMLIFWPAAGFAKPVAAVIYPNDAKITEHLTADIETHASHHTATFFLPIHVQKETLSINTPASAGMRITSVHIEEKMLPVADQAQPLKTQLKALKQKKSEFETRIKADKAYIDFWQNQAKNQPDTIESIDAVEKLGNAIKKGITDAHDEIYLHNRSIEDLEEQIREIEKQLNDLTGAAQKRWQINVYLTGSPQPAIDLTCSYHIRNCSWRPTYTINARPADSEIELNWYAEITQNTGIDWNNIELKIATARPVIQPEPPFLRDWIIQPQRPVELSNAKRSRFMAEDALMSKAPAMSAEMQAGAAMEPEQEAGFSFDTYRLGTHTIKAGDLPRFTIREMTLNADFKYLIRPQAAPQAFLFAQMNDADNEKPEDFLKLPQGEATFLVDSAFIAIRQFSMHDREQKFFFGSDPELDVTLTTLEKKSDETGFLMGKKRYQWGWKVAVHNLKSHKINVLMEDAYPQIRDERIKLKETFDKMTPEKEDNLLKWSFLMPPNTEKEIEYGFSITYPDDMTLSFGGR